MSFTIKRHDTRPAYIADLVDDVGLDTQAAIDLTAATTVTFKMRSAAALDSTAPAISRTMTIVDAATGRVRHDWEEGDTDDVGDYSVEFEIAWADGGVETVPNDSYLTISIVEDLDAD